MFAGVGYQGEDLRQTAVPWNTATPLLDIRDLHARMGDQPILKGVTLQVCPRRRSLSEA